MSGAVLLSAGLLALLLALTEGERWGWGSGPILALFGGSAAALVATGMNTVMRTIGGVVGGQVGAALLVARTTDGGVPAESAYVIAFAIGAASALVGALVALLITRRRRLRR
ncbi:MAG: hypothetical protein ICV67_04350 [Thermoleophilia bacterium]|nr:hypothetical protein [Thermoleophilia bacterium]